MSAKLDQSLDEILNSQRRSAPRPRTRRAAAGKAPGTTTAPVGGIKKNSRPTRSTAKSVIPTGPSAGTVDSKIIVSNLVSRHVPPLLVVHVN